jgi:hypothetical protein
MLRPHSLCHEDLRRERHHAPGLVLLFVSLVLVELEMQADVEVSSSSTLLLSATDCDHCYCFQSVGFVACEDYGADAQMGALLLVVSFRCEV